MTADHPSHALIRELLRPEAFPHAVAPLDLKETHISWVILAGRYAYKIKKPVKLDFLDASTLERRRELCEEELRLNHRLAGDLYLDVVAITRQDGRLTVGGTGVAVEYAVRMEQFASTEELPSLLAADGVAVADMTALAEMLARFHQTAPAAPWTGRFEQTGRMYETVLGNLAELATQLDPTQSAPELRRLIDWTFQNARALEEAFHLREAAGCVRECHGDLHAANVVRHAGRLVPFDCIEFDPKLRWIDVINDIAFLVMDLASHGHDDFAFVLLSRYLEITGDYEGLRLLPFYAVYRALVRAKVDALSAEKIPQRADEFRERLQRRLAAAGRWMEPGKTSLIIMHGLSGSGKSWLSERLVPRLPAVRLRSDLERKRLAGIGERAAPASFGKGLYTPDINRRTYARLLDCAETALGAGCNVIVDATFLQIADRELFQSLAHRLRASYAIVSCEEETDVLDRRLEERAREGHDPSDATPEVLRGQLGAAQPFTAAEAPHVVTVVTRAADAVASVTAQLRARATLP